MSNSAAPSVRLALAAEAAAITQIQRQSWIEIAGPPAETLLGVDPQILSETWTAAIGAPRDARCRVLVAIDGGQIVGFASTQPGEDPDSDGMTGAIGEFVIAELARGRGNGSRLLQACVDTLRADGFTTATHWVLSANDGLRRFLTSTGWAADGAHREIGTDDGLTRIKQVRLHTAIG